MVPIVVLMSVYNEPLDWLKRSIQSILNQTFRDFEFIIVNDNPHRQELKDILKSYDNRDGRIRIIENCENLGPAGAKNKALRSAGGRYIAIMDADDISLPERLKSQYQFLEKNSDIFLVGTSVQITDQNGVLKEKVIKHKSHKLIVNDILTGKLPFYHPTIMFRNEGFSYRDKFTVTLDYDFYLVCLSKNKKFGNLKQVLLHYRVSDQSISMTKKQKQVVFKKLAFKFYSERIKTGKDSYLDLDFNDQEQVLRFLGVKPEQLEAEAFKEKIVFALAAGDYEAAQQAFECYKEHNVKKAEKFILCLFLAFPWLHKLYRKLRYEILKF